MNLDQFLANYPAVQSVLETMKPYFKPLLLLILGLLVVIRGIRAEDKTPPTTLQIGVLLFARALIEGIKHRVPEEECTRKSRNGDKLKMHYQ